VRLSDHVCQAAWKDTFAGFMNEVRNMKSQDLSDIGGALKKTFDLLNMFRLQTGIDSYGMVRFEACAACDAFSQRRVAHRGSSSRRPSLCSQMARRSPLQRAYRSS
jgi:hypothetical protein